MFDLDNFVNSSKPKFNFACTNEELLSRLISESDHIAGMYGDIVIFIYKIENEYEVFMTNNRQTISKDETLSVLNQFTKIICIKLSGVTYAND